MITEVQIGIIVAIIFMLSNFAVLFWLLLITQEPTPPKKRRQGLVTSIPQLKRLAKELEAELDSYTPKDVDFEIPIVNTSGYADDWRFEEAKE